jgi:hypothetical protein
LLGQLALTDMRVSLRHKEPMMEYTLLQVMGAKERHDCRGLDWSPDTL